MAAELDRYYRGELNEQPRLKGKTPDGGLKGILHKIQFPGWGRNRETAQQTPEIITEEPISIRQTPEPEPDPEEERLRLERIEKEKDERSVISEIRFGVNPTDYKKYLKFVENSVVKGHINPLPYLPDWENSEDVHKAEEELGHYFAGIERDKKTGMFKGNPNDILPMTAINQFGDSVGFVTLKWKGDKFLNIDNRVAGIERIFCDPELQGRGIGKKMLIAATNYAFYEYKGYRRGLGAVEMRAWVMQDQIAGDTSRNHELFRKRGFKRLQGPTGEWESKDEEERYSICYKVEKDSWEYGDQGLLTEDQPVRVSEISIPNTIEELDIMENTTPTMPN